MEKLKNTSMLTDAILFILGIIILLNPWGTMETLVKIAGIVLIIAGLAGIVPAIMSGNFNLASISSIVGYIGAFVAGIILLTRPGTVLGWLHVLFGIVIIFHGAVNLIRALDMRGSNMWQAPLVMSIIAIVAGALILTGVLSRVVIQAIGVVLIFNSVTSLWMAVKKS